MSYSIRIAKFPLQSFNVYLKNTKKLPVFLKNELPNYIFNNLKVKKVKWQIFKPIKKEKLESQFSKLFFGCSTLLGGKIINSTVKVYCDASINTHDRLQGLENNENDPQLSWSELWNLVKPQLHYFLAAIVSALLVALANIQIPSLLGEIVNVVARFSQGQSQEDTKLFLEEILQPSIKIIKVYASQALFTFMYITFLTRMAERMASDLRQQLFSSLLKQDIAFYDKHRAGELINRLTTDVQDFKSNFKAVVSQGMRSISQIIGCGFSIYAISPQLAGMTALIIPPIIGIGTAFGSLLRTVSKEAQRQVGLSTAVADECLGNIRTVRSFAMEDKEMELFSREIEKSRQLNERLGTGIGLFQSGSNLFLNGIIFGTLYAGGKMVSSNQLKPGDLMAFLVSIQTIQRSLAQLSVLFGAYVRGVSAGARVVEYINEKPSIWLKGGIKIQHHSLLGSVEFTDVSFSYPTRPNQEVLKHFNLNVPCGKVVAIVGSSGAGKSTLAQLLERFYDVNSGSVSIDNEDVQYLDPSWLRSRVLGYVNQEPVLFATSIMENIRYGRPEATDQEVMAAAKIAYADEFITGFPNGYETVVGERGVTVSGGQKQRIAIARTILKDPPIMILDEATSALDAESEALVQLALENCSQNRTVIVIAHRLSTIKNADIIAVMSEGKIAEMGSHESLKKLGGIYANLIKQQENKTENKKRFLGS